MHNLIDQELAIRQMLNRRNTFALEVLNDMFVFFEYDANLQPTVHPILINAIYVEQSEDFRWKLTEISNVSISTSNRYRHKYIDYFYLRYNAAIAKAEAAATSDE